MFPLPKEKLFKTKYKKMNDMVNNMYDVITKLEMWDILEKYEYLRYHVFFNWGNTYKFICGSNSYRFFNEKNLKYFDSEAYEKFVQLLNNEKIQSYINDSELIRIYLNSENIFMVGLRTIFHLIGDERERLMENLPKKYNCDFSILLSIKDLEEKILIFISKIITILDLWGFIIAKFEEIEEDNDMGIEDFENIIKKEKNYQLLLAHLVMIKDIKDIGDSIFINSNPIYNMSMKEIEYHLISKLWGGMI